MVVCLEQGVDLHMAQLMPLPLTVSCLSKIQIGFAFLVPAHPDSPGQRAVKRVCVCARPALVTRFKQPLQVNDFATFDMLPFIPLHFLCTHSTLLVQEKHRPTLMFHSTHARILYL